MIMINKLIVLALLFTTSICSASSNNQQRLSELCQEAFGMMTDRYGGGVQCFVERAGTLKGFSVHSIMDLEAVVKDIKAKKAEKELKLAERKEQHRKQLEKKKREIELRDQKIQTDKENRIKSNSHRKYAGVIMDTMPEDNEILVENSDRRDGRYSYWYDYAGLKANARVGDTGTPLAGIYQVSVGGNTDKNKIDTIVSGMKEKYQYLGSKTKTDEVADLNYVTEDKRTLKIKSNKILTHVFKNDGDTILAEVTSYYLVPLTLQSTNGPVAYSIDVQYVSERLLAVNKAHKDKEQKELKAQQAREKKELSGF